MNTPNGSPASSPAPTRRSPERIAVVSGDRACGSCGFNLHGQNVVREEHYDMLMVRCPECGQVASLHEYPVLGPWAKRVGFVLAAVWLLVMLAAVAATTGALMGGSMIASEALLSGVTRDITVAHAKHSEERLKEIDAEIAKLQSQQDDSVRALSRKGTVPDTDQVTYAQRSANLATLTSQRQTWEWILQQGNSPNSWVEEDWWKAHQDKSEFTKGFLRSIDWRTSFWTLVGTGLMPLTAGVFWAVTAPRWRGRSRLLAWFVFTLLGVGGMVYATIMRLAMNDIQNWTGLKAVAASSLARELLGLTPTILAFTVMSLLLLFAMRFGRAWVRLAVRALLPPRLRASFGFLWLCDGKDMPRTRSPSEKPA